MVAPRERVQIVIEMDRDPVPGTFHTVESCGQQMQAMLRDFIPHYNPKVINASASERE